MKRLIALLLSLLLLSGCSLKVESDVFYLPQEEVDSVEIQMEIKEGDETVYRAKEITEQKDLEKLCENIRKLPVRRASSAEPHPITEFPLIIIIKGAKEHHLILTEEMAFYDQIAYEYTDRGTFSDFVDYYNGLTYEEKETEPDRF